MIPQVGLTWQLLSVNVLCSGFVNDCWCSVAASYSKNVFGVLMTESSVTVIYSR
jgi:hypothetical protein